MHHKSLKRGSVSDLVCGFYRRRSAAWRDYIQCKIMCFISKETQLRILNESEGLFCGCKAPVVA